MRIRAIEIKNHAGVGDLALSFLDTSGATYPMVVLAGGNGTGKTAVLDAIQKTFEGQLGAKIGEVALELECDSTDVARLETASEGQITAASPPANVTLSYDSGRTDSWAAYQLLWTQNSSPSSMHVMMAQDAWKEVFKSFLSEAAIDFQTGQLQAVTSLMLDDPSARTQRSGQNIAQRIGQLLVDIRAADAEDLTQWVTQNPGTVPPATVMNTRFSRFEKAFNAMFPFKRFHKVERRPGEIRVEFEEFGRISSLNTLSTGEKQIVFRAGFLLQNLKAVSESIVLVDEPELSLHPEWQEKIAEFYVALLSDPSGNHPQIIFSTHSPFIVHGAPGAKPIILEKDSATGAISEMPAPHYPSSSGSQAVRAFNIESFLQTAVQPMLILTEGVTDTETLNTAWSKIRPGEPRFFEARAALGDRNISITLNDQEIFSRLGGRMIVGLFDFDSAYNQWNGVWRRSASTIVSSNESDGLIERHSTDLGWAMLLPVPQHRSTYASRTLGGNSALSIEFLFQDSDIPSHMVGQKQMPLGAQIPYFMEAHKTDFSTHVASLPAAAFAAFSPLFDRLEDMHGGRL